MRRAFTMPARPDLRPTIEILAVFEKRARSPRLDHMRGTRFGFMPIRKQWAVIAGGLIAHGTGRHQDLVAVASCDVSNHTLLVTNCGT